MKRDLVAYVTGVALAAVALTVVVLGLYPLEAQGVGAWAGVITFMVLTFAGDFFGIKTGKAVFSVSLIPTVSMVPLFGPAIAVLSSIIVRPLGQAVWPKSPTIKKVFNSSQSTLAIGLGAIVYTLLGGTPGYEKGGFSLTDMLLPFGGLIITYFLVNTALVSTAIALDSRKRIIDMWRQIGPVTFANDLASSSFALFVVFAFTELGVPGLVVVVLPLFFLQHSYGLHNQVLRQNREILEFTIRTIEAKDPYTSGHSIRVAGLSKEMAQALRLPPQKVEEVETSALLHDVGKIDFAYAELIGNPATLTDTERDLIRSHPVRGARLLASLSSLGEGVISAVRHHHEHYDGNGYPDGLSGASIPLAARIIMVADTVDAMLSDRPYRSALSVGSVADELRRLSGRQFDPTIVRVFLERGMLERAARRAEMDRTPLPLPGSAPMRASAS